jgi:hypothetical protein
VSYLDESGASENHHAGRVRDIFRRGTPGQRHLGRTIRDQVGSEVGILLGAKGAGRDECDGDED